MSLFRFRVDSDLLVKIQFQLCPALVKNFQWFVGWIRFKISLV
jgi:hypothetical protein